MKKIVIFAGTTEGRRLSEILADAGIAHTVCVATEYGEIVMREQMDAEAAGAKKQPLVSLHRGRMDRKQIEEFLRNEGYGIVVDATHPYAKVVTENLRGAVAALQTSEKKAQFPIYLRLEREISETPEAEDPAVSIRYFESNADCAKALENTEGNILLTTGSKELATYCASGRLHDRLYVRILPGRESLELCMEQGIKGRQILALQGPFSTEMNAAILKQYDIRHMVTKNSGRTGGYREKLEAAKMLGIPVYVIEPARKTPDATGHMLRTDTYSFTGICGKLEQLCDCKLSGQGSMEICLAGIGMGSKDGQTQEVQHVIETADILLGAERMIEGYSAKIEKRPYYMAEQILPYLEQLQKNGFTAQKDPLRVTVLFSGDTGFYSGCRKLYVALQETIAAGALNAGVRILPGISSVVSLAARVGESYEDAAILSMHGKKLNRLSATVESHEKVFLLTSGSEDIRKIGRLLAEAGLTDCEVTVGYQLSYPEESIQILTPEQCEEITGEGLYTCLIRNPHWQPERLTHGRADICFLRDAKTPMTKEEVREVSICKLHLTQNAVVYDIGSGTGSVAIEIAGVPGGVQVYAIERKPEAVELLRKNQEQFHMDNIQIIEAPAPEGLEELPVPTHAFIGGSGGRLLDILQVLYRKNPHMRIVINAISMETIAELKEVLDTFPVEEEEILQMQVSRVKKLGGYHLPQAENPVWICSFTFREIGTAPMDNAKKTKPGAGETGNGKNGEVQR